MSKRLTGPGLAQQKLVFVVERAGVGLAEGHIHRPEQSAAGGHQDAIVTGRRAIVAADFARVVERNVELERLIEASFYRGQIFLQRLQLNEAYREFSNVVERLPDFRAYWFRSKTCYLLKDVKGGRSDIAQYLRLKSGAGGPPTELAIGRALRELAVELQGEAYAAALEEAGHALRGWLVANPNDAEALEHLGAVQQAGIGTLDEAIQTYSLGLTKDPARAQLRNMRGWAYVDQKQYEPARADFAETVRRDPADPEAHAGLGYVWALEGASSKAREEAATALLHGSHNYLVLHQVDCVYAQLSARDMGSRLEFENLALGALERAVALWRKSRAGPDELQLIRVETAFPDSLKSRPEFERLLRVEPNR